MIDLKQIQAYYPPLIQNQPGFRKYMLKEYVLLMILDYLSTTVYVKKLVFIGGTCIRFTQGINRFSEDLDFDCKDFSESEFKEMTDSVVRYLLNFGLNVETRDRPNPRLKAFRRSLYFPELLFELKLSGHREERFLVKLEAEDQKISYDTKIVRIRMDGFFFPVSVPEDPVLCAMKLAAMLDRRKGRDFYDSIFLLSRVMPDYHFLGCSCGIHNSDQLFRRIMEVLNEVDLSHKARDFEHLVFRQGDQLKILNAADYFEDILG